MGLIFISTKTYAAISFSEIAWMGSLNSSADEWIELYNSGENFSLDGFIIESQSKKLSIALSGSISKNSYYLIERTDDSSVPSVVADLVASFGTGLNNAGDNIYLKNQNGEIVDSLLYSSGWPAGDNSTKQTMQKVSGSWVTMDSTPKSAPIGTNSSDNSGDNPSNEANTFTNQNTGSAPRKPVVNLSRFSLNLLNEPFTLNPVRFEIDHRDENGKQINYSIYKVNFGDGVEKSFKYNDIIEHTYKYPGVYQVTARQFVSDWSITAQNKTSLILNVANAQIQIDTSRAPVLVVKNLSDKDIDLGQFIFFSGPKTFALPENSVIFAGKDLWLSPDVTGFSVDEVLTAGIMSTTGFAIYNSSQNKLVASPVKSTSKNITTRLQTTIGNSPNSLLGQSNLTPQILPEGSQLLAQAGSADVFDDQKQNKTLAWVLFGALIIIGSVVFLKVRKKQIPESEEFTLLEE